MKGIEARIRELETDVNSKPDTPIWYTYRVSIFEQLRLLRELKAEVEARVGELENECKIDFQRTCKECYNEDETCQSIEELTRLLEGEKGGGEGR